MTLEDYKAFERELSGQKLDVRSFLKSKNVKPNQYYYWKRKYNAQQESVDQLTGQFFPINILPGDSRRVSKSGKNLKQPLISQGEIEIELRTASGAVYFTQKLYQSFNPKVYHFNIISKFI